MRRTAIGTILMGGLALLLLAAPASAFPLTNCTLQATALAADGSTIGSIASGADDATQEQPFLVDWDGTISYSGSSQIEMKDNTWHVDVFGIPTPLSGGDPNTADTRDGNGTVGVSENAPFRITGLYYVSGSLTGSGGSCTGSGWFKLTGDPIGTVPFFGGFGLLILGLVLMAFGVAGHTVTGIVGGVLTGLGAAVMLVIYSTLPFGSLTPIVILLAGIVLGILASLIGRRLSEAAQPAPLT
jgi:hypothetical protein